MDHDIVALSAADAQAVRADLVDLLVDAVEDGASVGFVWPMRREKAESWWDGALAATARGERIILIARKDGRIEGSVQLVLGMPENQPFRADVSKMLVHRRARKQGLGARLLAAAETAALAQGRDLLVLDTIAESDADRLYRRCGWQVAGDIPGYATRPDGQAREPTRYFYKQLAR